MKPIRHHNILFFGPPGCGKTLLASTMFGEAGWLMYRISAAEFFAPPRVDLMQCFRSLACEDPFGILFVHIDKLIAGLDETEHEHLREQLTQPTHGSLLLCTATTRHPEELLLNDLYCFHDFIPVTYPDKAGRLDILNKCAQGLHASTDVLEGLATTTEWWSGKELTELVASALDENTRALSPKLLANLRERIGQDINAAARRDHMLEILQFARRWCTSDSIVRDLEARFSTISRSSKNSSATVAEAATNLRLELISPSTGTHHYRFYVRSREVPEPQDRVSEGYTVSEIIKILEQDVPDTRALDLGRYRVTPWVAYQLGHWAEGLASRDPSERALAAIDVIIRAARESGDETRVFAALNIRAIVLHQLQDFDEAIRTYQSIIDWPSFRALHERAIAHINLVQILVHTGRMSEAIHHFEVGIRCLGHHVTAEARRILVQTILEAYRDRKDLVGVGFSLYALDPDKARISLNEVRKDRFSLEQAIAYTARAHALGYPDLASAIYETKLPNT